MFRRRCLPMLVPFEISLEGKGQSKGHGKRAGSFKKGKGMGTSGRSVGGMLQSYKVRVSCMIS